MLRIQYADGVVLDIPSDSDLAVVLQSSDADSELRSRLVQAYRQSITSGSAQKVTVRSSAGPTQTPRATGSASTPRPNQTVQTAGSTSAARPTQTPRATGSASTPRPNQTVQAAGSASAARPTQTPRATGSASTPRPNQTVQAAGSASAARPTQTPRATGSASTPRPNQTVQTAGSASAARPTQTPRATGSASTPRPNQTVQTAGSASAARPTQTPRATGSASTPRLNQTVQAAGSASAARPTQTPRATGSASTPGPNQTVQAAGSASARPSVNVVWPDARGEYEESDSETEECLQTNRIPGWTHEALLALISAYESHQHEMESGSTKKKLVWRKITSELAQLGHNFIQNQVECKWRYLVSSFNSVKANQTKTGAKRKTFTYQAQMEDILGKRHDINPPMTSGSANVAPAFTQFTTSTQRKQKKEESTGEDEAEAESSLPLSQSKSSCRRRKKRREESEKADALVGFLQGLETARQEEYKKREENRERRAKERNDLLRELFSSFNKKS